MKKMIVFLALILLTPALSARAANQEFKVVAIESNGVKFWLPSTFTVHKGDTVKFNLDNKINDKAGNVHGFAIPDYNVAEVVEFGKPKTVEITANKSGIFTIKCQLHPGHVGGQLVVLE